MKKLEYPFDSELLLKKKKSIKKELLETGGPFIDKKIAVLGGSTTNDVILMMELFLLNNGIRPEFYESEYNSFYQDGMFDNPELKNFAPDIIYIHTSNRNISSFPAPTDSRDSVNSLLDAESQRYKALWDRLIGVYGCPVIQNNFEYPYFRLMGNLDAVDYHGRTNFICELNRRFYIYAQSHDNFYINDINYLSSCYGLEKWSDPFYWHMYKYCLCVPAIPELAFNISNIIKAIYGKNKKALALDLDNTLWGGIVGDDGVDNLVMGPETSMGQVFTEWQNYLKGLKELGILLNVDSKNDYDNAIAGLNHPDCVLKPDDFINIKANWDPKDRNLAQMASEINILPESIVFVDDNPAERAIVSGNLYNVCVPEMTSPEHYINIIDRSGFFEPVKLSDDDLKRNEMYKENAKRAVMQASFADYGDYLKSLEMTGIIKSFESLYMARIVQLTNKSNQFNLTTRRYTQAEIESVAASNDHITLYGKLIDKFGDNGVVSIVIGSKHGNMLDIDLWLMSCRVLKRDMEFAMMDILVRKCIESGIKVINGTYLKTAKNAMVKDFYDIMGFTKVETFDGENTRWRFEIPSNYENKNKYIKVEM